jgi:hypothetical protein
MYTYERLPEKISAIEIRYNWFDDPTPDHLPTSNQVRLHRPTRTVQVETPDGTKFAKVGDYITLTEQGFYDVVSGDFFKKAFRRVS